MATLVISFWERDMTPYTIMPFQSNEPDFKSTSHVRVTPEKVNSLTEQELTALTKKNIIQASCQQSFKPLTPSSKILISSVPTFARSYKSYF